MFRHALLLSLRGFRRYKSSFAINVIGLATGLFCAIMIYLWVADERKVDKFHATDERLFLVLKNAETPDGIMTFDETPGLLAQGLAADFPEVQHATPVITPQRENKKGMFIKDDRRVEATDLCVGEDFFSVFSFPLVEGNADKVLSARNNVVISDALAISLFGTTTNIVGRQVKWNRIHMSGNYLISGVFKKVPSNSSLQFDALFNYDKFLEKNEKLTSWKNGGPATYIVLKKGSDADIVNTKIARYIQEKGAKESLFIQRYSDRYLNGQYENGVPAGGRIAYVRLFSIVALFILIIACINFMNLSTARAFTKLKEVGVKKVMGASRISIALQYTGESVLLAVIALLFAIIPVLLFLPAFNQLSGKDIQLTSDTSALAGMLVITLITGVVSGSYPALYLSGFKPEKILKGKMSFSPGESWVRKALVMFQFAISIVMIISVLVVYKQVQLIQNKNLGYNRDNLVYFARKDEVSENNDDYKQGGKKQQENEIMLQAVRGVPGVINAASFRHNIAAGRDGGTTDVHWPGKNDREEIQFTDIAGGYQLIETMGMELKQGRSFSTSFGDEEKGIILNEAAVSVMGLKDPVGKTIKIWGEDKQIIGVVKNFHFQSLYENIKPCFLYLHTRPVDTKVMVRIKAGTERQTLARLGEIYREFHAGLPFEYTFVDEDYQKLYASEKKVEVLSGYFAGITIVISCLGLFGLAAFTVQKRRKEIGIRRVLGSGNFNIAWLLWGEFSRVVTGALLVAMPVSYLLLKTWLNDFAYRVDLSWWYFVAGGAITLIITWLTVSSQTLRALRARPAESLRQE
jgi:putative ABC transport system permease protein